MKIIYYSGRFHRFTTDFASSLFNLSRFQHYAPPPLADRWQPVPPYEGRHYLGEAIWPLKLRIPPRSWQPNCVRWSGGSPSSRTGKQIKDLTPLVVPQEPAPALGSPFGPSYFCEWGSACWSNKKTHKRGPKMRSCLPLFVVAKIHSPHH